MHDSIVCEERHSFVVFVRNGETFLTFLLGGALEVDYTVQLTQEERDRVANDPQAAARLVISLRSNFSLLQRRKLEAPIWPTPSPG